MSDTHDCSLPVSIGATTRTSSDFEDLLPDDLGDAGGTICDGFVGNDEDASCGHVSSCLYGDQRFDQAATARRHGSRGSCDCGDAEQDERDERDDRTEQVAADPARPKPLDIRV